ncbi:MAG TPA: penicillin-binding transpeptidase domain-containing protein [Polyangiaceae bacterium]|nr:penicillin-binding transpeptidase domain-containing protein [Polyangiaceae bacterium]
MNVRTNKTPAKLSAPPNEDKRRRWVRLRMGMLCGALALGLGLVVSSGYDLMIGDGAAWRELAETQRQRRLHVAPKRGGVYDRNGSALAVSVEVPSVSMDAVELLRGVPSQQVPVVARDAANRIAAVLGIDAAQVERRILAKRRFAWLKRQISAEEADKIRALSEDDAGGATRIRGLVVEGEGRRYYPRRELAGPLLGFVAPDGEGKDGLEYALNDDLKGSAEQLKGLRDRSGRLLFSDGIEDDRAFAGHNIYLTIDQGIQYVAEHELQAAARTFEAAGGSVVVVNPYTGEILALASWPFFNPNDYTTSQPEQRRDRAMSDVFEPGSTMKMFTVAAGLADGVITPTQKLYCEKGVMQIDNVTIRDTHPSEWLSISQILAVSSNICAAKIGLGMGEAKLYDALRRFGFGQESGLPFPGEAPGTLRPRSRPWVQVETASAAFGQGIGVTNMQMAMAAAALANGGELMEPLLVRKVTTSSGEIVRDVAPHVRRRVVSKEVARAVSEMLVAVTEGEGTGTEAAIDGYRVAGKTATAQKSDPKTGRYSIDKYIGSFVGFVPAEKPVVAIAVTLDEPMLEHAGGVVAAPIFRRVAQMSLKLAGLTPRTTDKTDVAVLARTPDPANIAYEALREAQGKKPPVQEVLPTGAVPAGKVRIPNLTGVPARQAFKQMISLGLTPRLKGNGLIVNQQPPPGSVVDNASEVLLVLEPAS